MFCRFFDFSDFMSGCCLPTHLYTWPVFSHTPVEKKLFRSIHCNIWNWSHFHQEHEYHNRLFIISTFFKTFFSYDCHICATSRCFTNLCAQRRVKKSTAKLVSDVYDKNRSNFDHVVLSELIQFLWIFLLFLCHPGRRQRQLCIRNSIYVASILPHVGRKKVVPKHTL